MSNKYDVIVVGAGNGGLSLKRHFMSFVIWERKKDQALSEHFLTSTRPT